MINPERIDVIEVSDVDQRVIITVAGLEYASSMQMNELIKELMNLGVGAEQFFAG